MNPLTLSIIGLYKTAVIRRRDSWRTHAGHGVDGSTQPVPHARAVGTGGIVGPTPCACAHRARSSRLALADDARSYTPSTRRPKAKAATSEGGTGAPHGRPSWRTRSGMC